MQQATLQRSNMQDFFGKTADLSSKRLFLFDMDGTIYRENELFDGVIQLLDKIERNGGKYVFITNNPSKSVKDYVLKLCRMGIVKANQENFFTSTQASIAIMKEKFFDQLIYAQGTKSFIKELKANGLKITQKFNSNVKVVLLAFDPEITGKKLRTSCEILTKLDVPYYATNPDWVCPVSFGAIPDCGSMCEGIWHATGKRPIYIGKPQPTMVDTVREKFSFGKEQTLVIGDRLYTDIATGNRAGVDTVCVLSGEATIEDIKKAVNEEIPTYVFESVKDLLPYLS